MPVKIGPNLLSGLSAPAIEKLRLRFERKVVVTLSVAGCHEWTGSHDIKGYSQFSVGQKWAKAHRVSYELYRGGVPHGMYVLHQCDNPGCVNPEHLTAGTAKKNTDEMFARKRDKVSKLTPNQVLEIRASTEPHKVISKKYGICKGHVSQLKTGRRGDAILLSVGG